MADERNFLIDSADANLRWVIDLVHPGLADGNGGIPPLPGRAGSDALLGCIARQRVAGLAWRAVAPHVESLPPDLVHGLRAAARHNSLRGLVNTSALVSLHKTLSARGIDALPLKGPALGQQLYGNPGLRHAGDIDVLVPAGSLRRVDDCLQALGYRRLSPVFAFHGPRWDLYRWYTQHASYWHGETGVALELHWRLNSAPSLLPLAGAVFGRERETVVLADTRMCVFSAVGQLLYLCTHGARHGWSRLQWLCDLPPLLAHIEAAGLTSQVRRLAGESGLERPVRQALLACDRLWPGMMPSPHAFLDGLDKPDRVTVRLLRGAAVALAAPESRAPRPVRQLVAGLRNRMLLKRSWRYKWECLSRLVVNLEELDQSRLRGQWIYLYPALRPFMWLGRRLRHGRIARRAAATT